MQTVQAALPYPHIDPVIFSVGPLSIRWYGLAYVVGILLGWRYARLVVSRPRLWAGGQVPMKVSDIDDFLLWAAVGIVVGGRLGYVLFYDFPAFSADPLRIFQVWNGRHVVPWRPAWNNRRHHRFRSQPLDSRAQLH